MAESHKQDQPSAEHRRIAPAAGCFGIQTSADLHEAERRIAAERDCPSLEEFEDHYYDPAHHPDLAKPRRKFESAH